MRTERAPNVRNRNPGQKLPPGILDRIRQLHNEGLNFDQITLRTGVSRTTIRKALRND